MNSPADSDHVHRGRPNIRALDAYASPNFDPSRVPLNDLNPRFSEEEPTSETSFSSLNFGEATQTPPPRRSEDSDGDEDDNDEKNKLGPSFGDYLISTTGFQGPGKIHEAPHSPLKILWLVTFIVAFVLMVYQLVELFGEFFSFPTKTVVQLKFSPLPLPALTLCNVNPVRKSMARNLSCPLQTLLRIPHHLRSQDCAGINVEVGVGNVPLTVSKCKEDCGDDAHSPTLEDLDRFAMRRWIITQFFGMEPRANRRRVGHQLRDLIVGCYIFDRPCEFRWQNWDHPHNTSERNIITVNSFLSRDYGNCYTLSAHGLLATKSGPESALVVTVNLENEEFVEGYKTGYGLRVVLHDNGARPFPSTEGFTVSTASETDFSVRMTQVQRKGGKYGNCAEGGTVAAISGYKYTIATCRDQCLRKVAVEECGCIPVEDEAYWEHRSADASPVRSCNTEEYTCILSVWERYVNTTLKRGKDMCNCATPCEETMYTPTLSSRAWPILSHIPVLEQQVCKLNNQCVKCTYKGENFTAENLDIRRSFVRLRLFYERLTYDFVEEKPFYDVERFLSDIGGTLGLWMGVTALGVLELFEIGFLAVTSCRRLLMSRRLLRH